MTSLREAAGYWPIDRDALAHAFVARLEPGVEALRAGRFDATGWTGRQSTTGRVVELVGPDGASEAVRTVGSIWPRARCWSRTRRRWTGGAPSWSANTRHVRLAPTVGV